MSVDTRQTEASTTNRVSTEVTPNTDEKQVTFRARIVDAMRIALQCVALITVPLLVLAPVLLVVNSRSHWAAFWLATAVAGISALLVIRPPRRLWQTRIAGTSAVLICLLGMLSFFGLATDREHLAALRKTDPQAYLLELKSRNPTKWESELSALAPAEYEALVAERRSRAEAACDKLAASPYDKERPPSIDAVPDEKIDASEALRICEIAVRASPGNRRMQYQLGRAHAAANDHPRAWGAYATAAERGHVASMIALARLYTDGRGVGRNTREAARWLEKAAEAGDLEAMLQLAGLLSRTSDQPDDRVAAVRWWRKAAEAGAPHAMTELGAHFDEGRGTPIDRAQARHWWKRAAEAGETRAMVELARLLQEGQGGPKDEREARRLWQVASQAGDAAALFNLGRLHSDERDLETARSLWEQAATSGSSAAMLALGDLHAEGKGVPADPAKAAEWWDRAAKAGNEEAESRLLALKHVALRGKLATTKDRATQIEILEELVTIAPGKAEYRDRLNQLEIADLEAQIAKATDTDEKKDIYKKLVELAPNKKEYAQKLRELEITELRESLKDEKDLPLDELVTIYSRLAELVPSDKQYAKKARDLEKLSLDPAGEVKFRARRIAYRALARQPDTYEGTVVVFRGKVIQVVEGGRDTTLRIDVTRGAYGIWDDTVYVEYRRGSSRESRILENDIVTFWGTFVGIKSYTAVLGNTIQIPYVVADVIEAHETR